jgi:ABC-2 type transport system permease protein
MITSLRKYTWVGVTSARSNLAYLSELASRMIFLAIILFVFAQLWRVTYSQSGQTELGGLTIAQMLWYLAMTEAITMSGNTGGANDIDQDVRTGTLAVQLIRPISYPLYRLSLNLGERLTRCLLNALVGMVIVLVLVGPISLTLLGPALFLLSLPFAFTLDFLGVFLIGMAAFWLEDTSGLLLIYRRTTMILGGMLIPLQLFPESWQPVLRLLPFSSIVYGPAHLLIQPSLADFGRLLVQQGIGIAVMGTLCALVFRIAVRRINGNGG